MPATSPKRRRTWPEQMRAMPPAVLYPMVLDQLVDRKALVAEAQKQGLEKDPAVQRQITRAEDQTLQNAVLSRAGRADADRGGDQGALRRAIRPARRARPRCTRITSWSPTRTRRRRSSPS